MTTAEVGQSLVGLCREGKAMEAEERFYDENIVSVEPQGEPRETHGLAAVKAKAEWWYNTFTVHSVTAEGPFVNGDQFTVRFGYDFTENATNTRTQSEEVALYTVKDGKIVHEIFFDPGSRV